MGRSGRRRSVALLTGLALIAATLVATSAVSPTAADAAAASSPLPTNTTVPGGGVFGLVDDPRALIDGDLGQDLVLGPDGRPWFSDNGLYSIASDGTVIAHPLPGTGNFGYGTSQPERGSDGSLWLPGPGGMLRITADGVIHQLGRPPGFLSNWGTTGDGRVVVTTTVPNAVDVTWMDATGALTTYQRADFGYDLKNMIAGPNGSVWGNPETTGGYAGIFPDGSRVTLAVPVPESLGLTSNASGQLYLAYDQDGSTRLSEFEPNGAEKVIAVDPAGYAITDNDVIWGTSATNSITFHRMSDPSWAVSLPSGFTQLSGECWQQSTSSLFVAAGTPDSSDPETVFQVTATGAVARLQRPHYSFGPCEAAPDGSVWSSSMSPYGSSWYFRANADGSEVTTDVYGSVPRPSGFTTGRPWVVTDDDTLWMPAVSPASTTPSVMGIGHLTFAATDRLAGSDRFDTAAQIARRAFPAGASVVYLASGLDFPDALAAGPAAARESAPLLLTAPGVLPVATASELTTLAPSRVVIVGGAAAVTLQVEQQVRMLLPGASVQRDAGPDRFATADAIVSATFSTASTVYVATGDDFPDALSASAAAGSGANPVVLVDGRSRELAPTTRQLMAGLHPSAIIVVGGASAVSDGILSALQALAPATRVSGSDRFETSAQLADTVFPHAQHAYLASGTSFPDALTGGVWAATTKQPLLATTPGCLPAGTEDVLHRESATSVTVLGGTDALDTPVDRLLPCVDVIPY